MSDKMEKDPKLDALAATKLLENVFEECNVEPNTVPMEALSAYSGYRKERFFLQRLILVIAIVLFMLLPLPKDTYAWLGYYSKENLLQFRQEVCFYMS